MQNLQINLQYNFYFTKIKIKEKGGRLLRKLKKTRE